MGLPLLRHPRHLSLLPVTAGTRTVTLRPELLRMGPLTSRLTKTPLLSPDLATAGVIKLMMPTNLAIGVGRSFMPGHVVAAAAVPPMGLMTMTLMTAATVVVVAATVASLLDKGP